MVGDVKWTLRFQKALQGITIAAKFGNCWYNEGGLLCWDLSLGSLSTSILRTWLLKALKIVPSMRMPWPKVCLFSLYCCSKIPDLTTERRQDLFWLMISEVSVHDQSAPLLWLCGKRDHHNSSIVAGKTTRLMAAERWKYMCKRPRERYSFPTSPQWLLQQGPTSWFLQPPNNVSNYEFTNGLIHRWC